MPNTFNVADWITMNALRSLVNNLKIAGLFNTDFNKEYTKPFPIGETARVKLPWRPKVGTGIGWEAESIIRTYTSVTVDRVRKVHFEYDSIEEALRMERGREAFKEEYLDKAMEAIAQEIDSDAAQWAYLNTNNVVGALGTNPSSMATYTAARARMTEQGCPPGERHMIISPQMQSSVANSVATVFNPTGEISKAFMKGQIGQGAGFDRWFESMSLYSHTAGTWAGTVETDGAGQSGGSLLLTATTGDTFLAGDVFTIEGVYAVNPMTRRSTGALKQFTITADVTAAASAATITFTPAIVGPGITLSDGQTQNVSALPANDADLVLMPGTTTPNGKSGIQGLALHRDAFALVGVPLAKPKAVEMSSVMRDPASGLSVRLVETWNNETSSKQIRLDTLYGFGNLYPDACAVRVQSLT